MHVYCPILKSKKQLVCVDHDEMIGVTVTGYFLGRRNGSSGRAYVSPVMCLLSLFSPRVLRAPSTDHPETLPHGQNLAVFYNPTPKIHRALPPKKKLGPKTCKISVNFGPLQTLIANISGTAQDIQNWKANVSRTIPPAFNEKDPVNFGPLITEI